MKICYDENSCVGCGACQSICPVSAVKLSENGEGFRYPGVDTDKCINCGMCQKVCPLNDNTEREITVEKIYGLKLKNTNDRMMSSSGGAFAVLARHIINSGGVVCGAVYDEDLNVVHYMAEKLSEIERMRGSKYVQSNIEKLFECIEIQLKNHRTVLFTGTPCQCDAISHYCKQKHLDTECLLLCDIICHGVPSPKLWKEYCDFIQTDKKKVKLYNFRDKRMGWHGTNVSATYSDGSAKNNTQKLKIYSNLYFDSLITRPSCTVCKYASFNRVTDFTIGDFWGCEANNPSFADPWGVSLVMLHSQAAVRIFEKLKPYISFSETNRKLCTQEHLRSPVKFSKRRDAFWNDYENNGFRYVADKYADYNFKGIIIRELKNIIKVIQYRLNKIRQTNNLN